MCYAFSHVAEADVGLVRGDIQPITDIRCYSGLVLKPKSLKRPADGEVEDRPAKIAKCSADPVSDEKATEKDTSEAKSSDQLAKDLEKSLTEARNQNEKLKKQNQNLKEQKESLEDDLFSFQASEDKQKGKAKAGNQDEKALEKQAVKRAREAWKTEEAGRHEELRKTCQKKIDRAREDCAEKIVAEKEACKQKISEYKAKNLKLEKETKDTKADYAEAKKDLKAETEDLQKSLREEQLKAIKAWKPEHSKTVKEKDDLVKERDKKIQKLRAIRTELQEKTENLQGELDEANAQKEELEANIKAKDVELEERLKKISEQHQSLATSTETNEGLIGGYNAKLVHEGKRWQLQYDRAEKYAKERTQLQRQAFIMRQAFDRATKRIEDLQTQLSAVTEQVQRLTTVQNPVEKVEVED